MIFSPVGDEGSSITISASVGAGNVRVMILTWREWSDGTLLMSFFRRSSSRTGIGVIFSLVGDEGSSMSISALVGAGNVRLMIWTWL